MNKNPKILTKRISIRLTEQSTTELDFLCSALGVTRSEFVRGKVDTINKTIMKNKDIFNITEGPATDAWGRDIAKLQSEKEQSEKQVMNQVKAIIEPPAEPAATIFNVKGYFGHFNTKFNMHIQAATKEKATAKAKSFHGIPGRVVTVTSVTAVTAASVKGKKLHKA